ncbi:hypothetical protein H3Z85_17915 [Chryseobacterium indologenes]|uniref:hypothetical protein n=1 Tax=Chryseobacterium indologenes TaxID=253 RepID=UPI0004B1BB4A|nr:hypothetical protein [Chryseobacterium indologenes]QPQ51186.1 hypothetical protein H3Z85_17915 [Chryseobacterium indologenes]SFK01303.1 hypothetical protein SAMN05421692_3127 [Chryseobacterium indologenes]SUX49573.1 Uncharacterised protein [Chryseobacterium indologenes]
MANYKTISNAEARRITETQSEKNPIFNKLKEYLAEKKLGFNYDRNIGFVGVNPNHPDASYTMIVTPTFTEFDFNTSPSHVAASIISYYIGNSVNHTAAIATINHDPLDIADIALLEVGKEGRVVETNVDRKALESEDADQIAKQMSISHFEGANIKPMAASVPSDDQRAMVAYILDNLLNDKFASPLYPEGGVQTLLKETSLTQKFNRAVELRASLFEVGLEITVCTSTSSNACTSTSSSFTIDI